MWTKEQIIYFAGIFDGEGSIYIQRRKRGDKIDYCPRFQIVNTHQGLMEFIHKTFGGLLYSKDRSRHDRKWRIQYEWHTTRPVMDELLPLIIPYLIVKKPHAEILYEFRKTFPTKNRLNISAELSAFREDCLHKIRSLNKRGVH